MDNVCEINKQVDMVVVYKKAGDITTACYPYKMKHAGKDIIFTELGLRHPTTKGKRMVHIFDMSDGVSDYRLEFDAERLTWVLVSVLGSQYGA
jgi:hypothetical protein